MKKLSKTQYNEYLRPPKEEEIIEGEIVKRELSALYLDLGPFGTGVVQGREFDLAKDKIKNLKIGDRIKAQIINLENEEGFVELSLKRAERAASWKELEEKKEKNKTFKVKIIGANKGGLLTKVNGIAGFIPASQLASDHYPKVAEGDEKKILKKLRKMVDEILDVKILDLSKKERRLILSEKATKIEEKKKLLENYKIGDIIKGEVTGLTDFGVFVKFHQEKLEGLIHISELKPESIEKPSEILKKGKKIKAKIINIQGLKVSLSLKDLKSDS